MKKILKFVAFSAILLMLVGSFFSCNDKEQVEYLPFETYLLSPSESNPIEYPLDETSCQWTNLSYRNELIVINSDEEMKKYVDCPDGVHYPDIDFSKYTLLLANGYTSAVPFKIEDTTFSKYSTGRYTLNLIIHYGFTRVIGHWHISILVPKIANEAIVELDAQFLQDDCPPM